MNHDVSAGDKIRERTWKRKLGLAAINQQRRIFPGCRNWESSLYPGLEGFRQYDPCYFAVT
jgi:hypothetical protein